MAIAENISKLASLLFLAAITSACTASPDLQGIEVSLSSGSVGAGASRPAPELSQSPFGQRIKAAIDANPDLAQSASRLEIAAANENSARGAFLPQVSVGINARSERYDSEIADATPYLRISQLIYDGGAASNDLAAAKAHVLQSRGDQLQSAAAIALAAIEAYVLVLDRQKILDIERQNVVFHKNLVAQISKRSEQGAGSNADVLTARSRMADAQTRLADARARLDRANAQYYELFGNTPSNLPTPVAAPKLTRTDTQIVLDSPLVRRTEAAVLSSKAERSAILARRQPGVRLAAFADQDDSDDANFGVDLSFNYEIDSTGQRRAAIAAAEARVKEAEFVRDSAIRDIRRELDFIRSDQNAGAIRLNAARIAAKANADSVTAAQAQFTIGRRSLIEILDAQRDYVNAQERLILAEQNFFLTNYAALSITGDILDLLGVSVGSWSSSQ